MCVCVNSDLKDDESMKVSLLMYEWHVHATFRNTICADVIQWILTTVEIRLLALEVVRDIWLDNSVCMCVYLCNISIISVVENLEKMYN